MSDTASEILKADRAITTVAEHVIHAATMDGGGPPEWENYPEIGENDWDLILARVDRMSEPPDPGKFDAAYALLTGRADHDA